MEAEQVVEGQYLLGQRGEGVAEAYTIHNHQQFTEQEVSYEGKEVEQEEEEEELLVSGTSCFLPPK